MNRRELLKSGFGALFASLLAPFLKADPKSSRIDLLRPGFGKGSIYGTTAAARREFISIEQPDYRPNDFHLDDSAYGQGVWLVPEGAMFGQIAYTFDPPNSTGRVWHGGPFLDIQPTDKPIDPIWVSTPSPDRWTAIWVKVIFMPWPMSFPSLNGPERKARLGLWSVGDMACRHGWAGGTAIGNRTSG